MGTAADAVSILPMVSTAPDAANMAVAMPALRNPFLTIAPSDGPLGRRRCVRGDLRPRKVTERSQQVGTLSRQDQHRQPTRRACRAAMASVGQVEQRKPVADVLSVSGVSDGMKVLASPVLRRPWGCETFCPKKSQDCHEKVTTRDAEVVDKDLDQWSRLVLSGKVPGGLGGFGLHPATLTAWGSLQTGPSMPGIPVPVGWRSLRSDPGQVAAGPSCGYVPRRSTSPAG
jgi:hypothetical protein